MESIDGILYVCDASYARSMHLHILILRAPLPLEIPSNAGLYQTRLLFYARSCMLGLSVI
jgi:hypothetical protein